MTSSPEVYDPLSHLPKDTSREKAGHYVDGGFSPYVIESLRPGKEYLASRQPGEPLLDYIKRHTEENPQALTRLITDSVPAFQAIEQDAHLRKRQRFIQRGRRVLSRLLDPRTNKQ